MSKKKATLSDDLQVSAPLFVKHHYLVLESVDGSQFVVDRNAAIVSRVILSILTELAHRSFEEGQDDPSVFLADGDVQVVHNAEQHAISSQNFPIVYPSVSLSLQQAQSKLQAVDKGPKNNKQLQTLQQQVDVLQQQVNQFQTIEDRVMQMVDTPLTHLRFTRLNSHQLETAIRFMYYKYKNDLVLEVENRSPFFGFVADTTFAPTNIVQSQPIAPIQPKRRSIAPSSVSQLVVPDPSTAPIPAIFSDEHMTILAVTLLLQM